MFEMKGGKKQSQDAEPVKSETGNKKIDERLNFIKMSPP